MVDPVVTDMVTAVAAGAVAAFKDDAKDAVQNAFVGPQDTHYRQISNYCRLR